ncbi:hypothetical protein PGT21_027097 [Puccinia graminis f. sp. tritici]|uniref:Uncharacterized protein n=1 Tax=Puccinia graminis f. sp. tritici TaxID=56615 RepID=A0A5B0PS55_PUCGR|nr:hypothetical protein PGTUg99_008589 [Puccinia graminis f. sp. tritici]KAA1104577.1 hypothetical protein PGT21_027097 [Puccinia graminis f. sp. tritici]
MKFSCSNAFPFWLLVILPSTFHLPSTACLKIPETSQVQRPILAKRGVIVPPRFVIIPLFGPVSFNEMFDWGVPLGGQDGNRIGSSYETRVKHLATQAIGDVVEQYAKAHPEMAKTMALDMHEIYLEESGQLSQTDERRVIKAREDLAKLFKDHPELQSQAEDKFQFQVDNLFLSRKPSDWKDKPQVTNDWAHINPHDD